jgi:membrane protein YdbS with pleckstrin-like domain
MSTHLCCTEINFAVLMLLYVLLAVTHDFLCFKVQLQSKIAATTALLLLVMLLSIYVHPSCTLYRSTLLYCS